jgi:hypothetical protein
MGSGGLPHRHWGSLRTIRAAWRQRTSGLLLILPGVPPRQRPQLNPWGLLRVAIDFLDQVVVAQIVQTIPERAQLAALLQPLEQPLGLVPFLELGEVG